MKNTVTKIIPKNEIMINDTLTMSYGNKKLPEV